MTPLRNFLITVQAKADFTAVRRETDRNRQQMGQYVREVQSGMRQAGQAVDGVSSNIRAQAQIVGTAGEAVKGYFAVVTAAAAPEKLKSYADAWTNINNRLQLVTKSNDDFKQSQSDVLRIALQTHQPLEATAELYQRLVQNSGKLGLSAKETGSIVETLSKAVAISGVSSQVAEMGIRQLAQGLAAGTLRGQDLRSVLEEIPGVAQAIANGMGKDIGEIRALAEAGQLTVENIVKALQNSAGDVDAKFNKMTRSISQAFTDLETRTIAYIGRMNEASGVGDQFGKSLEVLGDHINVVVSLAAAFGASKLVPVLLDMGVAAGRSTDAFVRNAAAIVTNAKAQQEGAAADVRRAEAIKATELAELSRLRAVVAAAAATHDEALETLAGAQAALKAAKGTEDEARAKVALIAATKEAEAAERALAAATNARTAQTGRAAAATRDLNEAQIVANASANRLKAIGSGLLGLFGGPAGLVTMVAAAAVGWLVFRDNSNEATQALVDMQTPLDQAIAKFKELGQAQQQKVALDLGDRIEEQAKKARSALNDLTATAFQAGGNNAGAPFKQTIDDIQSRLQSGAITIKQASAEIVQANERLAKSFVIRDVDRRSMADAAASYEEASTAAAGYRGRLDALNGAQSATTAATHATTAALDAQGSAVTKTAEDWSKYASSLETAVASAGLSAGKVAEIAAKAKGYSTDQAKLAGNLAAQQEAFTKYKQAIADGDKAQADSIGKTLENLSKVELQLRAVIRTGSGVGQLASSVAEALAKGDFRGAGTAFLAGVDNGGVDPAAQAKAEAELKKHLADIDAGTPASTASKNRAQSQQSAQAQAVADIRARIAAQDLLTASIEKYGAAADKVTDGDRRVLAIDQQLKLAVKERTNNLTDAELKKQRALAQVQAAREHANQKLQDQAKLAQLAAEAELNLKNASADRAREAAREIAAVGQTDQQRALNSRIASIEERYRAEKERYNQQAARDGVFDPSAAEKYFAELDNQRESDIASEKRYQQQLVAAQGDWTAGAVRALGNYRDKAADIAGQTDDLFTSAFQSMEDSLVSFVTTGKLNFKSLASDILKELARIEVRILMSKVLQSIMGAFMGSGNGGTYYDSNGTAIGQGAGGYGYFGGDTGGYGMMLQPNAKGGVYSSPSLSAYSGQIVSSPTVFAFARGAGVMGEAGPEAILPLARGSDGKLGVRASGDASGSDININTSVAVDASGGRSQTSGSDDAMARQVAGLVNGAIQQAISRALQPGGSIWKYLNRRN